MIDNQKNKLNEVFVNPDSCKTVIILHGIYPRFFVQKLKMLQLKGLNEVNGNKYKWYCLSYLHGIL